MAGGKYLAGFQSQYRVDILTWNLRMILDRTTTHLNLRMEAPFDASKTKEDLMNFSGSAGDMMAAMAAAGIVVPEAQDVRNRSQNHDWTYE
jgi:hypothetical protein